MNWAFAGEVDGILMASISVSGKQYLIYTSYDLVPLQSIRLIFEFWMMGRREAGVISVIAESEEPVMRHE